MTEIRVHSPWGRGACVALLLASFGCATGSKSVPSEAERSAEDEQPTREVITAEDIARTGATTAWEALERLVKYAVFTRTSRGDPNRIRRRGASSLVLHEDMRIYLDGIRILDVQELDETPAGVIDRIEVLSGLDGTTRYGTGAGDGVILIFTKG
jgi:outer membrane cobalamin receptor